MEWIGIRNVMCSSLRIFEADSKRLVEGRGNLVLSSATGNVLVMELIIALLIIARKSCSYWSYLIKIYMLNRNHDVRFLLLAQRTPRSPKQEWKTRSRPQAQVAHLPPSRCSSRISIAMCSRVRQPTMMYFRIRIGVVDDSLLLVDPMSIPCVSRRMSGPVRNPSSLLTVCLVPGIALLLAGVPVTVLIRRTMIGRGLWHRGRGARHGRVVRRTKVIAIGVMFLMVGFLFSDQGTAAANSAQFFGVVIGLAVALEVGFLAGAGGVVVGRGGAVFLLFLVVAVQQDGHNGSKEE